MSIQVTTLRRRRLEGLGDAFSDQMAADQAASDARFAQTEKWGIGMVAGVMVLGLAGTALTMWFIYRVSKKQGWV